MSFNPFFDLKYLNSNTNSIVGIKDKINSTNKFIIKDNSSLDYSSNLLSITGSLDTETSNNNNVLGRSLKVNNIKFGGSGGDDSFGIIELSSDQIQFRQTTSVGNIRVTGSINTTKDIVIDNNNEMFGSLTEVESGKQLFNVDFEGSACGVDYLNDSSTGKRYAMFRASSTVSNCFNISIAIPSDGSLVISTNSPNFPSVTENGNQFYCGDSSDSSDARLYWNKGTEILDINIKDHPVDFVSGESMIIQLATGNYAVNEININLGDSSSGNIFKLGNKIKIIYKDIHPSTDINIKFIPGSYTASGTAVDAFRINSTSGVMPRRTGKNNTNSDINGVIDELLFCDSSVRFPNKTFEDETAADRYLWAFI